MSFSSSSPSETVSVTTGFPWVSVPVLSNTTAFILHAASSGSPPLIRIPCSAPRPVPTIIAVGVASPNAHGHAITITAVNVMRANARGAPRTKYQMINVRMAMLMTVGTKYADTLSANAWIGALDPCASSVSLII